MQGMLLGKSCLAVLEANCSFHSSSQSKCFIHSPHRASHLLIFTSAVSNLFIRALLVSMWMEVAKLCEWVAQQPMHQMEVVQQSAEAW